MPLCVYAIVPASTRLDEPLCGLQSEMLLLVKSGAAALILGEISAPLPPDRANLHRHDLLIRTIASAVPAVLPARFGTTIDSIEHARALVKAHARTFGRALRLVSGREQMTLRLRAVKREPLDRDMRSGTEYMAARGEEFALPQRSDVTKLLRALSPIVHSERAERSPLTRSWNFYHLIPRGQSVDYLALVNARAQDCPGIEAIASGPFPPYAFAPPMKEELRRGRQR